MHSLFAAFAAKRAACQMPFIMHISPPFRLPCPIFPISNATLITTHERNRQKVFFKRPAGDAVSKTEFLFEYWEKSGGGEFCGGNSGAAALFRNYRFRPRLFLLFFFSALFSAAFVPLWPCADIRRRRKVRESSREQKG